MNKVDQVMKQIAALTLVEATQLVVVLKKYIDKHLGPLTMAVGLAAPGQIQEEQYVNLQG